MNQHFKMMACCDLDKMKMSAGGGQEQRSLANVGCTSSYQNYIRTKVTNEISKTQNQEYIAGL